MNKLILIAAVAVAFYFGYGQIVSSTAPAESQTSLGQAVDSSAVQAAFNARSSGVQVQGEGVVSNVLADDTDGSRHQRFILELPSGQTLLVAHNIDLAPRIPDLTSGDIVIFSGVYEWNAKGGVVHWTHHDPAGRHQAGWLRHAGQTYQ